jgi:hypothetical protein
VHDEVLVRELDGLADLLEEGEAGVEGQPARASQKPSRSSPATYSMTK